MIGVGLELKIKIKNMEKEKYQELSPEEVKKFEDENMTDTQREMSDDREKERKVEDMIGEGYLNYAEFAPEQFMDNFEQRLKVLKNSIRTVDVNHGLKVQVYGGGGAYFERRKWVVGIFRSPTPDNKERSYSLIIPFKMNGDDLAKNKEIINNLREQIDIKIHEFFPDVEKRVEKQIKNLTFRQTDPKDDDDDSLSATVYFIKKEGKEFDARGAILSG